MMCVRTGLSLGPSLGLFSKLLVALLVTACLVTGRPVLADSLSLIKAQGFGTVDPNRFRGPQAKMLSRRAAIVDAQRNLVETIEGVRITSGTTVKDMTLESDAIGTRVKSMLQGAFILSEKVYEEAGGWTAEVELAVCLNGGIAQCKGKPTLAQITQPGLAKPTPEQIFSPDNAELASTQIVSKEPSDMKDVQGVSESTNSESGSTHTGLIVDVSTLNFSPMLDVRVQTEQGKELYGPGHVQPGSDWLHWARTVESAKAMTDIVGNAPMLVPVAGIGSNEEILVTQQQAIGIYKENLEGGDFLQQGKVIFVVN